MISRLLNAVRMYLAAPVATSSNELDRQIVEEIEFHLSERAREGVERGLTEPQARREARERFGDPALIRKACRDAVRVDLMICHHLHLALTVGLFAALIALLWAGRAEHPAEMNVDSAVSPQFTESVATQMRSGNQHADVATYGGRAVDDGAFTGNVAGQVLDENGQPLAGANVLVVVKTWPYGRYRQQPFAAVSAADGRYCIADVYDPQQQHAVQIAIVADGHALQSSYDLRRHGTHEPAIFQLRSTSELVVRMESENGAGIGSVEVVPHRRVDPDGREHVVYFCGSAPVTRTSDGDGHVRFSEFQPGDTVTLLVRVPHGVWQERRFVVPQPGRVVTLTLGPSDHATQS